MSGVQIPLPLKSSPNLNLFIDPELTGPFLDPKGSSQERVQSSRVKNMTFYNEKVLDGCLGKEDIGRETARNAMGKNETFCDP